MSLFGLFEKEKRTLKDVSLDDLKREQLSLQQEQRKLDVEAEKLGRDETQLASEYAQAQTQIQKKAIARKVQNVRMQQKAVDTKSAHCHKLRQTVNNFALIRDNMAFYERMGVASELMRMDMAEVESFINDAMIDGQLQQEKLANMLQQVGDVADQYFESSGDDSLDAIMAEMDQQVAGGRQSAGSVRQGDDNMDAVVKELDAAAARGEQIARQLQSKQANQDN